MIVGFLSKHDFMSLFPRNSLKLLENIVNVIIGRRKSKLDNRDDFIQFMIEHEDAKGEKEKVQINGGGSKETWNGPLKKTLTNKEILSQSVLFLLAGYETTATTLEFITYNLAMNPDVQEKLIHEVDAVLENHVI